MIFSRFNLGLGLGFGSVLALAAACSSSSSGAAPTPAGGDAGPNSNSSGNSGSDPDGGNSSNAGVSNGGNSSNGNDDAGPGSDTPDADTQVPDEPSCDDIAEGTPTWTMTALDLPGLTVTDMALDPFAPIVMGFNGVAYGNGVFVATVNSTNEDVLRWATSSNGVDWEAHSRPLEMGQTVNSSFVHFLNGKFVYFTYLGGEGGGVIHTSSNGMDWTSTVISPTLGIFAEFDSSPTTLVGVAGNGDLRSSNDLETFTPHMTGDGLFSFNDVTYGNGRFLAATNNGGQVFGSDNGEDWELIDGVAPGGGVYLAFGNDTFIAVGQGQALWTSPDGVEFTSQTPIGIIGAPPRFAGGRFVSWRTKGFSFPPEAVLPVVSTDGIEWTEWGEAQGLADIEPGPQNAAPYSIADTAFGNCTYVMAGVFVTRRFDPGELFSYQPLIITASAAAATQ